jgi:hypothetical protein
VHAARSKPCDVRIHLTNSSASPEQGTGKTKVGGETDEKSYFAVGLTLLALALSAASFAQSNFYVLTNDVNTANTATLFNLNTDGTLRQVDVLQTGGEAVEGGYYAGATQVFSRNPSCVFVADGDTNDIATFSKAAHNQKVGNYSNPALIGASNMPMIENSAGTILYAAYELTSNIGVWTINSDCSLTLANVYPSGSYLGSMAITNDGKTLLVAYVVAYQAGSFAISGTTLTDNGVVNTIDEVTSVAVTNDDKVVIMGTGFLSLTSTVVTADLPGFTNQRKWTLGPGYSAASIALSPDAQAGNGCLYLGNSGSGTVGKSGVTGVSFTENPPNLTYVNNVTSPVATYVGTVVSIRNSGNGAGVYVAEVPGYVGVYLADSGCKVSITSETLDPQSQFILSLSSWIQ